MRVCYCEMFCLKEKPVVNVHLSSIKHTLSIILKYGVSPQHSTSVYVSLPSSNVIVGAACSTSDNVMSFKWIILQCLLKLLLNCRQLCQARMARLTWLSAVYQLIFRTVDSTCQCAALERVYNNVLIQIIPCFKDPLENLSSRRSQHVPCCSKRVLTVCHPLVIFFSDFGFEWFVPWNIGVLEYI